MHRDPGGGSTYCLDWNALRRSRLLSWLLSGRAEVPADPIAEQSRSERVRVKRSEFDARCGSQARSASRMSCAVAA